VGHIAMIIPIITEFSAPILVIMTLLLLGT